MSRTVIKFGVAVLMAGLSAFAMAQVGHPAKGSWLGYWGPSEAQQQRVVLHVEWRDRELSGVINPGPKAAKISRATIDYDTWTMVLEADLPATGGKVQRWVATGKIENLGSWTNRRYSGTYQHGAESGNFEVTLQ
jgi:hypothetical protein